MAKVRKHIYFSGQVQGVGFRYRATNAARANGLTGWVDNLWDGRVEMEVQGELSQIEEMIQEIQSGSFIRIEKYQMVQVRTFSYSGCVKPALCEFS